MKNSLKGTLLSGLVFPGLGQLKFKRYGRGILLILVVSFSVVIFFMKALQKSFTIIDKLQSEGNMLDLNAISRAVTQASSASDDFIMNFCLWIMVVCWIVGIVDAYLIGKKMENQITQTNKSKDDL